jgi:DNA topoisomerase-3
LIKERKVGPLEGFRSKTGRPFTALVILNDENKPEFAFENGLSSNHIQIDPATHTVLGPCQVCKSGQVYDVGSIYVCENVPKGACTFKMSKTILQREIAPDQLKKMLTEGKSDLLRRFISKKGRPFDASLTLVDGKIGWEFAKRESRARKKKPESVPNS